MNKNFYIGDKVRVKYKDRWYNGTVVSDPKIVLGIRYYTVHFIYTEDGKPAESVTATFGTSEIA